MLRCLAEFSWRGCWYKLLIALLFLAASFAAFSGISFADSKELGTAGSPNFRLQPVYLMPPTRHRNLILSSIRRKER